MALLSTAVVPLASLYAYGLTRTFLPGKRLFAALAPAAAVRPPLLPAISLIYIFGNQGFLKSWLAGGSIYGPLGIVMAQIFYVLPTCPDVILITAFSPADGRLYEAAAGAMGHAAPTHVLDGNIAGRALWPDLGAVRRLHARDHGLRHRQGDRGQFNVLATDAYKQVVGTAELPKWARVGWLSAVGAGRDRLCARSMRCSVARWPLLSARAVPLAPTRNAGRGIWQ